MTAGLGYIVAQVQIHFISDLLFVVNLFITGDSLVDKWIGVLAIPLEIKVVRLMVDTRLKSFSSSRLIDAKIL